MLHNYMSISKWYTPRKGRTETLIMSGTFTVEELYDAGKKIQEKIPLMNTQMNIGKPEDTALPDNIIELIQ